MNLIFFEFYKILAGIEGDLCRFFGNLSLETYASRLICFHFCMDPDLKQIIPNPTGSGITTLLQSLSSPHASVKFCCC